MKAPKVPKNELNRLAELNSYQILDTLPEDAFDNLTQLAAEICGTPIALISLLDESRQWFKSAYGLPATETSREISFCGHAILDNDLFEVENALDDERFKDNPLVTGDPNIRFYAGMPLRTGLGHNLGTLCVIDSESRKLDAAQRRSLYRIGKQVIALLEHRKALLEITKLTKALEESHVFHNALLNSADESIISTTPDGVITTFNIGAEDMLGYSAEEVVGKVTPEILHEANEVEAYAKELSMEFGKTIQPGFEVFVLKARDGDSDSRRWTYICKDGSKIIVNLSVTALLDQDGEVLGYLGVARDVTSAIEMQKELTDISSIMERTGEIAKVGGWELNLLNNDIKWSKQVFKIHEVETATPPALEDALNFYPVEARSKVELAVEHCIENDKPWDLEVPFITAKGKHIWVRSQGEAQFDNGVPVSLIGTFQDITQRKKTEIDLAWLNRALHMLSKSNHALAQINDEKKLMIEICRIAVELGGYKMAWVGYAEHDEYKTVSPQAYFGASVKDYIETVKLSWSESLAIGNGPAGKAIRLGKAMVVNDILLDPTFPVKELATQYGYRSLIAVPLKNKLETKGMLSLYSHEVRNFSTQEVELLQELVDNLQTGLSNIKIQRDSRLLNDAIIKVASSITANNSSDFFHDILSSITSTLKADAGYIAKVLSVKPFKASMLAVSYEGKVEDNFEFLIPSNMAKSLFIKDDMIVVNGDADKQFPQLNMMKFYPFKAFAGLYLSDAHGNDNGLVFVFFKQRIDSKYLDTIYSILKIFAARTASELERLNSDLIIREQASMLEKTRDAIVVRDMNQKITFWNKGAEALYGWTSDEVIGKPIQAVLKHEEAVFNNALEELFDTGEWMGEVTEQHKSGKKIVIEGHWTLLKDNEGNPKSIFAIKTDVTQRKLNEEQIQLLAFYDPLTSLPNRRLLIDRLEKAMVAKKRDKQFGAILFIDLDNFKKLNDTLGHDKGDLLLKEVSKRLIESVRESDTVARLGGDEFVIFVDNLTEDIVLAKSLAIQIAEKILTALNNPVDFSGYQHFSTPSIGIALFSQETTTTDEVLKSADDAMYQSKTTGRNKFTFFGDTSVSN